MSVLNTGLLARPAPTSRVKCDSSLSEVSVSRSARQRGTRSRHASAAGTRAKACEKLRGRETISFQAKGVDHAGQEL